MDANEIVEIVRPDGSKLGLEKVNEKTRAAARTCVMAGLMCGYDAQGKIFYFSNAVKSEAPDPGPASALPVTAEDQPAEDQPAEDQPAEDQERPSERAMRETNGGKSQPATGDDGMVTPEQKK